MIKKVAVVNDMSGIGRCSLAVSLPIISSLGVQGCPFPTALLSNHTGYPYFSFYDFTKEMKEYKAAWSKLNIKFNGIYTGFLGSEEQIDIVEDFIKEQKPSLIIVDPVMGDNGKIYQTYTKEMCMKMRILVAHCHIVTPNTTESCILTDKLNTKDIKNLEFYKGVAREIAESGPKVVVITGILEDMKIINLTYNKNNDEFHVIGCPYNNKSFSGTGDIFTSILCGMIINGESIKVSVEKATNFIFKCVEYTVSQGGNSNDGVMFERFLKEI